MNWPKLIKRLIIFAIIAFLICFAFYKVLFSKKDGGINIAEAILSGSTNNGTYQIKVNLAKQTGLNEYELRSINCKYLDNKVGLTHLQSETGTLNTSNKELVLSGNVFASNAQDSIKANNLRLNFEKSIVSSDEKAELRYHATFASVEQGFTYDLASNVITGKYITLKDGDLAIQANEAFITLIDLKKKLIDSATLTHNVLIKKGSKIAHGNKAVFSYKDHMLVLSEDVYLKDKDIYIEGKQVVYNTQTGSMRIE